MTTGRSCFDEPSRGHMSRLQLKIAPSKQEDGEEKETVQIRLHMVHVSACFTIYFPNTVIQMLFHPIFVKLPQNVLFWDQFYNLKLLLLIYKTNLFLPAQSSPHLDKSHSYSFFKLVSKYILDTHTVGDPACAAET